MIRVITVLVWLFLIANVTRAQEPDEVAPPKSPLIFGVATITEDEEIHVRYDALAPAIPVKQLVDQTYTVMVPAEEVVEREGVKTKITVMKPEMKTRTVEVTKMVRLTVSKYKMTECKFQDLGGTELPRMQTMEMLRQGCPVVTIRPGTELSDFYLKLLREDVVVLVCPEPKGPSGE